MNKQFLSLFLFLGAASAGAPFLPAQTPPVVEPAETTSAVALASPARPDDADDIHHLDTMIITGTVEPKSKFDFVQSAAVLGGQELAQRLQPTLGDTLAGTPGVDSTYFGPGAGRPIIRGLGGDRVRVLTGGVGTLDASVVSPDHAVSLEPLLIDRVEIVRGPASLLYGGSAIGGVVNVIDGRIPETLPERALGGRFEARGNTVADERAGAGMLTGAVGEIAWRLDGFSRKTDDIRIPDFAETPELLTDHNAEEEGPPARGRLPNSATETKGASFGLSYIGKDWHAGVAYSGFDSFYGVPGHEHHNHEEEEPVEEAVHEEEGVKLDLRQRRWDAHGEWLAPSDLLRAAKFQLGVADYEHSELEGETVGTHFENSAYEGRLELLHAKAAGMEGAFGWQFSRSDFSAAGEEAFVPPSVTRNHGLFLYEEIPLERWTAQFGGRLEKQKVSPDVASGLEARSHTVATFTGGVIWRATDTFTFALSASSNERAPNAQELYADGPHAGTGAYEVGDVNLSKEKSTGIDFSVRKRVGFVTGEVSVFLNQFDGYIFEQPNGDEDEEAELPIYAFVQRDARLYGGEVELTFHVHEQKNRILDFRVMADTVRATNTTDGTPLPRTTPVRYGAGIDWRAGRWSLTAEWRHVNEQDRVAPTETTSKAYDLASLGGAYRFVAGGITWELFVRGSNLLDETARVHASFLKDVAPVPGRSFTAGLRLEF
ncbi:MAG: TonB-dependent receptor [Verrucomicrobia bacterium]|nr:TonB-dependent receptor [Verrucomicrobiota bacterium]